MKAELARNVARVSRATAGALHGEALRKVPLVTNG